MVEELQQLKKTIEKVVSLDSEAWQSLENIFNLKSYEKNQYFAKDDSFPEKIGFIVTGFYRAFYRTFDGIEYNKTFFGPNDFILPLASLITGKKNQINIQALTPAVVLTADFKSFTNLYDSHHSIERFARKVIEIEWCKKETRELQLVLNTAEERYEIFLKEYAGLENVIPQYHIASYLGITPVSLSRLRSKRIKK